MVYNRAAMRRTQRVLPTLTALAALTALGLAASLVACHFGEGPNADIAGDPCLGGNARITGKACVLPAAPRDEQGTTDWTTLARLSVDADCTGTCDFPRPIALQMAQRSSDAYGPGIELRVALDGPPPDPARGVRYLVDLTPLPAYPATTLDTIALGPGLVTYAKSGTVVDPGTPAELPFRSQTIADGFVAWVSRAIVATRGGVRITTRVERREGDGWRTVLTASTPALACWDPSSLRVDPCAVTSE